MGDITFNIAKGQGVAYAKLPAANDAIVAIPLKSAGLSADSVLIDDDNVTQVLTHATEHTMGRKTVTGITFTVDDTNDRVDVDGNDITWTSVAGSTGAVGKLVLCWDGDTTSGTDSDLVPIVALDFAATPGGGDITFVFNASGFFRAN